MNVRQALIENIETDLRKITTGNGYNNTVLDVKRMFVSAEQITPPILWFEFQNESKEIINEDGSEFLCTSNLMIGGYVKTSNDVSLTGIAVNEIEKLLTDISDCVENRKSQSFTIHNIIGVEKPHLKSIYPYVISDNNVVGGIVEVEIQYIQTTDSSSINVTRPSAPTLTSPSNSSTSTTLYTQFDWSSVSNALSYHIQVGTDLGFNANIINQDYLVENSYTMPLDKALTNGNTYYWKVRSFNQYGYSDWSSPQSFVVSSSTVIEKDWNEFTGSNAWWNTYSDNALTISSGSVSAMKDQINTRNLTQATAGDRPSLSGNSWNSLSSVFFNPVFASAGKQLTYNDTSAVFRWEASTTGSIIIVLMTDGTGFDFNSGYNAPFARSNTNYGHNVTLHRGVNTGPVGYTWAYPYPSGDYGIVPIGLNIPQHIILTHSGSASLIYLNGTKIGQVNKTFTTFANEANTYLVLGMYYNNAATYASGRYYGHIYEFGSASAELTSTQVAQSYAKFKTRFEL